MHFELTHVFDCDVATYESIFQSDEYMAFLQANVPNIDKIELLSRETVGTVIKRRVRYSPKPGSYKVGPKKVPTAWTVFEEESSFDPGQHQIRFSNHPHIPQMLRDKFTNTGTMSLSQDGGKVRRTIAGEIQVKIFLVGKIAERIIHKAGADLIEQEAAAMQKYLAQRQA